MLERTFIYRMWQAPFAEQKFVPVLANNDLRKVRRVLDVGCGPGTNTTYFAHADYLGIDINERYIQDARRRHQRDFVVADVRDYRAIPEQRFDFVLANSFLHHLNTEDVSGILSHARSLLTDDGHIHCLELVLPRRDRSPACWRAGTAVTSRVPRRNGGKSSENFSSPLLLNSIRSSGWGRPYGTWCISRGGRGHDAAHSSG